MLMAIGARRISAKADFGSGLQKGFRLWTLEPRSQFAQAAVAVSVAAPIGSAGAVVGPIGTNRTLLTQMKCNGSRK
jgi:hypothetical protein